MRRRSPTVRHRATPVGVAAAVPALALLAVAAGPAAATTTERERYDTRVLAPVAEPGYPASVAVAEDGTVFTATHVDPSGSDEPSVVYAFDPDGTPAGSWTVQGQDTDAGQGFLLGAMDAAGLLHATEPSLSRLVMLDPATGAQADRATFADLPTCASTGDAPASGTCSDTLTDLAPLPNFPTFGPDGSLYSADFQQGVVWRVPPTAPGSPVVAAEVWLTDPRFDGSSFGPAGIAVSPDGTELLLAVASTGPRSPDATTGGLFRIPVGAGTVPRARRSRCGRACPAPRRTGSRWPPTARSSSSR